jgi:hypothetical protein
MGMKSCPPVAKKKVKVRQQPPLPISGAFLQGFFDFGKNYKL